MQPERPLGREGRPAARGSRNKDRLPNGPASSSQPQWCPARWPAPARVRALTTTRRGGVSRGSFAGLNLGLGSGDSAEAVAANRAILARALELPAAPRWLRQVHGARVVDAETATDAAEADACFARRPGLVCAVQTADCLPVLFCDRDGTRVAAAHAGWRGLSAGVLEGTVRALEVPAARLMVWLGPGIGARVYEVGDEVRRVFVDADAQAVEAFAPSPAGRWLADLYRLARLRLQRAGVEQVFGGDFCTYSDRRRFFSYRRDGPGGRMASLIWIDAAR